MFNSSKIMQTQSLYQKAIKFAAAKHVEQSQTVPGTNLPYVVHLSNVAMEILIASFNTENFDVDFAVQVALLHDTLEDTSTTYDELEREFGTKIAKAVHALTKNNSLPKDQQMNDSLKRIKSMSPDVWAVKLADRITNLQPPPPHWYNDRITKYSDEAKIIHSELKDGNKFLADRLKVKIEEYEGYIL